MTYIKHLDGALIDLDTLGVRTKDFIVSSPAPEHVTENVVGSNGLIDMGSTAGPRNITVLFKLIVKRSDEFSTMRDLIYELLTVDKPFYLMEKRSTGKQWLVKVSDSFNIEQQFLYGDFQVNFTAHSGYSESVGTTTSASTFEHLTDLPVTYTDYTNIYATKFKIYNAGERINPRSINDYLKITYKGNSDNLKIKNITTGDVWEYGGTSNAGDTIVLEGILSNKNGLSIVRQTNLGVITLDPGWNEFEITGAPDVRLHAIQAHQPNKKSEIMPSPITFEFKFKF